MNFSYYEVYINVLRAFTGMGFPYGADEDAAFIIAWLELNKLNGIKLLANSIDNIDQKYDGKINLEKNDFKIDLKKSSILMKGPTIIDYFISKLESKKNIKIILNNCSEVKFFFPLLYKNSDIVPYSSLNYIDQNNKKIICIFKKNTMKIWLDSKDSKIKKNQIIILLSLKSKNLFLKKKIKEVSFDSIQKKLSKSISPKINHWKIIEKIAFRTFVPESKESRIKGAGGGDAND
mgnify:CR=1 FL=1